MEQRPPTGDEMQQMLVRMRGTVEGRIAETRRPRSTARRVGIATAVVAVLGVGTASGAFALGMVPHPFAAAPTSPASQTSSPEAPSTTPSSAALTESPRPTPSSSPETATIPRDCSAAVAPADAERLFGGLVLRQVRPTVSGAPESWWVDPETPWQADASLVCTWSPSGGTEDVHNVSVHEGTTARDVLTARLEVLAGRGWTCTDTLGGRRCQHVERSVYYGEELETTFTFFVRGDTWVSITQTNIPTNGLLASVVQQTWGD